MSVAAPKSVTQTILDAHHVEDIFGPLKSGDKAAQKTELKSIYHQLAKITHPNSQHSGAEHDPLSADAFARLSTSYQAALDLIERGEYGHRVAQDISTPKYIIETKVGEFVVGQEPPHHIGPFICHMATPLTGKVNFDGEDHEHVFFRLTNAAADLDLTVRDAAVLKVFNNPSTSPHIRGYVPTLWHTELLGSVAGTKHVLEVMPFSPEVFTISRIRQLFPDGVPAVHGAWMFNRMMEGIHCATDQGVVCLSITPGTVAVNPSTHGGFLLYWGDSVDAGSSPIAIQAQYRDWYPPEVKAKQKLTPATDIYMAAKCALFAMGWDQATDKIPDHVPKPLADLLRACTTLNVGHRFADPAHVRDLSKEACRKAFGEPKFVPFEIPA